MAIIYKDFTKFDRICAIPSEELETIKAWADQSNLLYNEGTMPLNWKNILGEIREDFGQFVEGGGWKAFICDDSDAGEEEEEEDGDSEFNEDVSEQSDDEESDFSVDEESSSNDYEDEDDDDSEEGLSWEELD